MSLFLCVLLESVLISFFYMELPSFPRTTYWRDCLFSIVYSCLLRRKKERNKVKSLSPVRLLGTPWTVVHQSPPSMGFSRQEYWNGLPFPSPRDLPDPGIEPRSPSLQAVFNLWATREAQACLLSWRLINHQCVGLFLGSLFCSIDLCVCFCTSTMLFWLLLLCGVVWIQGG